MSFGDLGCTIYSKTALKTLNSETMSDVDCDESGAKISKFLTRCG